MKRLLLAFLCCCGGDTSEPDTGAGEAAPFDYCEPESPPDAACFAERRAPDSAEVALALEIAERVMGDFEPESLDWEWRDAVMMFSFVELYRVTGDTAIRAYYRRWIDHHIEAGYEISISDHCPPSLAALALYEELGDEKYLDVVEEVLHYLYEEAVRTEQGGISHMGVHEVLGATLWLDSLFMFGNLLTRWGELADDARALDEYSRQFRIFTDLLQDESGLYTHAYDWVAPQDDGVFWARGNAWVVAATYEYLRVRRNRGESDQGAVDAIQRLVEAFVERQDPDTGLWWTLLSHPGESYLETSAAGLVAFGLARGYRYGYLNDSILPVIANALDGLRANIDRDDRGRPVVTDISGPTSVGGHDMYASVALEDDLSYGIGAVILALLEASGLPL
jgi:unsaturated rhamnogalacturonyl hydrolase